MDPRLSSHSGVLELNTRLLLNCLAGMDDEAARKRLNEATNSAAFIAAHLVEARHFLAGQLGVAVERPFGGALEAARSIEDVEELPSLEEIRGAWRRIAVRLRGRLPQLRVADLERPSSPSFPVGDPSVLGALAFLLQHESYHIGQLAFLRKYLGFSAMSYD